MQSGFQPGVEVTDPDLLFGHNRPGQLLEQLASHLRMGTNVQVLGERRAGKTSVLRCGQAVLRRSHPQLIPVYLNYRDYPFIRGLGPAYRLLLAHVHAAVVASGLPDVPREIAVRGVHFAAAALPEAHLEALSELAPYKVAGVVTDYFLALNEHGVGVVLLIDEYEHLLRTTLAGEDGAFFLVRQISSQPPVRAGSPKPVTYVVAGVKPWVELCSLIGSPELNNIGAQLYVGPLDEPAFEAMWRQCLDGSSPEARARVSQAGVAVDQVYSLAGGWPFYGKVIGTYLCAGTYSPEVAYDTLHQHFDVVWSHLTDVQREQLIRCRGGCDAERDGTLNDLIARGLLISGSRIHIRGQLWHRYVQERAADAKPAAAQQGLPGDSDPELYNLTEEIIELITEINELALRLFGQDMFRCTNHDRQIYRDLRQPAASRDRFTHFALAAYNLIFERTKDLPARGKGQWEKALERLPEKFRREHEVVRLVDSVRHYYGKAHIIPPSTIDNVLKRYLGNCLAPQDGDFLTLQLGMLKDIRSYLQELYDHLRGVSLPPRGGTSPSLSSYCGGVR